jgi:hypothetical protein
LNSNKKNWKKLSQTRKIDPNQFEPVFFLNRQNQTETDRFESILVRFQFLLKKFNLIIFLIKTKSNNSSPFLAKEKQQFLIRHFNIKSSSKSLLAFVISLLSAILAPHVVL